MNNLVAQYNEAHAQISTPLALHKTAWGLVTTGSNALDAEFKSSTVVLDALIKSVNLANRAAIAEGVATSSAIIQYPVPESLTHVEVDALLSGVHHKPEWHKHFLILARPILQAHIDAINAQAGLRFAKLRAALM